MELGKVNKRFKLILNSLEPILPSVPLLGSPFISSCDQVGQGNKRRRHIPGFCGVHKDFEPGFQHLHHLFAPAPATNTAAAGLPTDGVQRGSQQQQGKQTRTDCAAWLLEITDSHGSLGRSGVMLMLIPLSTINTSSESETYRPL